MRQRSMCLKLTFVQTFTQNRPISLPGPLKFLEFVCKGVTTPWSSPTMPMLTIGRIFTHGHILMSFSAFLFRGNSHSPVSFPIVFFIKSSPLLFYTGKFLLTKLAVQ